MIQPILNFNQTKSQRPTLRDYQDEAASAAINSSNGILCEPTGAGKSLICGAIADRIEHGILILQPSVEILESNYEKAMVLGIDAEIYSASAKRKVVGHVTYATIGSIIKKLDQFKHCKTVIVDECHLVNAKGGQYLELIETLNPERLIGQSATPYRLNTSSYGSCMKMLARTRPKLFDDIIHVINPRDLVERGFLMAPEFIRFDTDDSMLQFNSTGANFSDNSIGKFSTKNNTKQKAVDVAASVNSNHILTFTESVDDAKWIVEQLKKRGITASEINALTDKKIRRDDLERFKSGEIKAMVNVGTLTTGFDFPALDCIIDAAPTNSAALHYQKIGRVVRPFAGKNPIVYDIAGNEKRLGNPINYVTHRNLSGKYEVYSERGRVTTRMMTIEGECKTRIFFGKNKGLMLEELSDDYLSWGVENLKGDHKHVFFSEVARRFLFKND